MKIIKLLLFSVPLINSSVLITAFTNVSLSKICIVLGSIDQSGKITVTTADMDGKIANSLMDTLYKKILRSGGSSGNPFSGEGKAYNRYFLYCVE